MSNSIPGPAFGLNEIINTFTIKEIEQRARSARWNPLRPSAAGKCERELGYEYTEYKGYATYDTETKSPETHRLLNLGDKIEWHANDEALNAFKHMPNPPLIKYKQLTVSFGQLPDGTFLEGKIDLAIEIDGHKLICDWKSKGDKYSQFYKSSWDEFPEKLLATGFAQQFGEQAIFITDLPKFLKAFNDPFFANNLYQLNFYGGSQFLQERGFNLCSVLQYNKNDSRIREVRFVPSPEVFNWTMDKFRSVHTVVEGAKRANDLKREYTLGSMKCAFCNYKSVCWPENDALKEWFQTLPAKQWPKDLDRLPSDVQEELSILFRDYEQAARSASHSERLEQKICGMLYERKIYKIRLSPEQIYVVKRLKEGLVLRRSKV